jgi:hypothetical protein
VRGGGLAMRILFGFTLTLVWALIVLALVIGALGQ